MNTKISLQHRPFGDYHPYEPAADERTPRTPAAGETVTIGVITKPINQVEEVWITFWTQPNQTDAKKVPCVLVNQNDPTQNMDDQGHLSEAAARAGLIFGVDDWVGTIDSFPAGTEVFYQITIKSKTETKKSKQFSYQVLQPISYTNLTAVHQIAESIVIECQDSAQHSLYLMIDAEKQKQVRIQTQLEPVDFAKTKAVQIAQFKEIKIGSLRLTLQQEPFQIQFGFENNPRSTIIRDIQVVHGYPTNPHIKLVFEADEKEAFFGFGERFDTLNQRGNQVDVRLFEQYKSQGAKRRTYMPMPLFISSAAYAFLLDSSRYAIFDMCHTNSDQWALQYEIESQSATTMRFLFGDEKNIIELTRQLTDTTGKSPMLPAWAFGLWGSANEWNTQKRVEEVVKKHVELDIPLSVLVIEAWSDEATFYIWNGAHYQPKPGNQSFSYSDFSFDPDGMWYDPKKMVDQLHQKGIHLILWQIPVLKDNQEGHPQLGNDHQTMLENEYYVKNADGSPYHVVPFWFKNGLLMDFTNPDARDWWFSKRRYLLDELGIDGFKTDGGEHLWDPTLQFCDQRTGEEMVNGYAQKYVQEYYQFAQTKGAITFSRSGFTGAQTAPCHWAGDENSTWQAFRHTVNAGLNAALSGLTFWGFDIGGFSGPHPSSELYLRATAFATFCPIMQYHAEFNHHQEPCNDRTPWQIDQINETDYVVPIFRDFTTLRYQLMPYLLKTAEQSANTGIPMMRPYCLEEQSELPAMQTAYYFGESLFVIPVLDEAVESMEIYLPAGEWVDFWTKEPIQGGKTYTIETPLHKIPVFSKINPDQLV